MTILKRNSLHNHIDQLLVRGKIEEAIPFIEEAWKQENQAEKEIIASLNRRLEALENMLEQKNRYNGSGCF